MHTTKARHFTSILSFPLISTLKSIYYKLHFLNEEKKGKKIQELAQGHPILCGIQNQVGLALILLWLLLLNLLEHFSKNKLAPKKSESISFSDGLTPSESLLQQITYFLPRSFRCAQS